MRIALVDFGSFVLPYDYHLARALAEQGHQVTFFGSETRFNSEFLDAIRAYDTCLVISRPVSRSVAKRLLGVTSYIGLVVEIFRRRKSFDLINLQFCVVWPIEIVLFWLVRKKFVFTVHNAVPHGFAGRRYWPYLVLSKLAKELWFPSEFTADSFYKRYSQRFREKGKILQHGTMGIYPDCQPIPYRLPAAIEGLAYWSNIKPYKGIELVLAIAQRKLLTGLGDGIEVYGCWSDRLFPVRDKLKSMGTHVVDRFLTVDELSKLLSRDLVFLLPYKSASQSGALYSLLHHGRLFIASDTGDLGAFLKRFGLERLVLKDATVESVDQCMNWLKANLLYVIARFAEAQTEMSWPRSLEAADLGRRI